MCVYTKWLIPLLILGNLTACADAKPLVDFLNNPSLQINVPPGKTSSNNLSPTSTVSGGVYQLKGRVTQVPGQVSLSGGSYKIKGKISF